MKRSAAYVLAVGTIVIWSSTFIATKVLLRFFTPIEILVYRFFLAWLLMFLVYPRVHRPESIKNELKMILAGLTGGTLYFVAENWALSYSLASNVSLLVATAPIMTSILAHFMTRTERITRHTAAGGLAAFIGTVLVIFNGAFILKLNPLGDSLALISALSWALYSIIIRGMASRYSTLYNTRKIFFYTLVTVIPVLFFQRPRFDFTPFLDWKVSANLLFLTLFASCAAYVFWTKVVQTLGATRANNFIYFIPLLTLAGSALVLGEPLTLWAVCGAGLIFTGVWITGRGRAQ